jgi:cystathionine beta-synthase
VEGFGEDFVPSTLDLSLIDEVVVVDDADLPLGAQVGAGGGLLRRFFRSRLAGREVRSGAGEERLVVVLLPDSGARYLSKIFDDDWMREHGFLEFDRRRASALQVAHARGLPALVTAAPEDTVSEVVARMRDHAVSQLPVVDGQGNLVGLVSEVDLLRHVVNGGAEAADQTMADVASRGMGIPGETPSSELPSTRFRPRSWFW